LGNHQFTILAKDAFFVHKNTGANKKNPPYRISKNTIVNKKNLPYRMSKKLVHICKAGSYYL